jgi:hypothetical protein
VTRLDPSLKLVIGHVRIGKMKITKNRLRTLIKEEARRLSEGWGIDTASRLPKHGVMIDDVKDEAVRLEKELYFVNQSGRAFKAMPDGSLQGLPNDELPSGIDDELVYTRRS